MIVRLVIAVLVTGTLGSLTDWLFMGVLFHARYNTYPEIWWPEIRAGRDRRGIIWASVLGYVSTAAIVTICALTGTTSMARALMIAALAWVAGPFLVLVVNGMFIKIDPRITFAHGVGYLARFLLAGLGAALAG
jgi:hypothetical protein